MGRVSKLSPSSKLIFLFSNKTSFVRGLIVKEPYATMIVRGEKKWEIRKTKTKIRGQVYIILNGHIIGVANLVDVLGPFDVDELLKYSEKHKIDEEYLKKYSNGKKLYAWVFEDPKEFKKKIKLEIPKGAQVWVKL